MKRNPSNRLLIVAALASLIWAGCSKTEDKPQQPAPPKPATPAKPTPAQAPAAPVQKAVSSATRSNQLDFARRTDPFKPYAPVLATPQPKAGEAPVVRPREDVLPIQSFETSKFKVSGIIAGLKENRALIIDPTGKGYVVQTGMQLGSGNGRITRITANSVEVVETFKGDRGKIHKRTIVLTLAKKR
ncbi:type IV pilus assembly lipoprotein PilP [Geomonas silvestris]|uniref:Type IV pilus assembly lipoprotein PilP n=1 Tax=Geomonas silvestris TaxID=2740184 RepID=A0A6V8MEA6_9BACT|nr:pilus assembly protein PilP [Geomonas silvestris]GFO58039.1 type IV pilus assembly lipoprotein PilP [Geomonas silvestris]